MEFIGLLGLIGLFGFFYGKNLKQTFNDLKSEFRRTNSTVASVNAHVNDTQKDIGAIKDDLQRLKNTPQKFVTADDLNKNSRYLQDKWSIDLSEAVKNFSSAQSNFNDAFTIVNELEKKISALPTNVDLITLQSDLKKFQISLEKQRTDFDLRLKGIETRPASSISNVPPATHFENRLAALEADRQNLLNQFARYEKLFGQIQINFDILNKKLEAQQKIIVDFDALNKKVEAQQKIISELESHIKKIPPPPKKLDIRDFHIKKRSGVLFANSTEFATSLAVVKNLSGIVVFLNSAPTDKRDSFSRIIKNYQNNLEKFIDKVQRGKFDDDTFSEEVTENFFSVLSKYFLATIPVAIYRGYREDPKFYSDFLVKVNEYLATCRVYSELVEPKKLVTSKQIECMTIFKKATPLRNEDKIIDEVEQLPYFLDYLNDDGETERFCADGKMILFSFGGGK